MKNYKLYKQIFYIIVLLSITIKLFFISNTDSTIDDNIVLQSIFSSNFGNSKSSFKNKIYDTSKESYNSYSKIFLRKIDKKYDITLLYNRFKLIIPYVIVSNQTTYAPFQYIITASIVNIDYSPETNIFLGRLPSLFFSILSIFLLKKILFRFFNAQYNLTFLYVTILFVFSHEFMIYNLHMSSYSIGVFAVLLLFYFYFGIIANNFQITIKNCIKLGLFLGFLIYLQYQVLFFIIPALFLLIFKIKFKKIIFITISFSLLFFPIYFLFLIKHANHLHDHWSNSYMKPFYFDYRNITSVNNFLYFFIKYPLNIFYYIICFTKFKFISIIFFIINFFLFSYGYIKLYFNKSIFSNYLVLTPVLFLLLIFIGKHTMSPSRHNLNFLPFFCIIIFYGLNNLNLPKYFSYSLVIFSFISLSVSTILYFNSKKDFYFTNKFYEIEKNSKSDFVITRDYISFLYYNYKNINVFFDINDKNENIIQLHNEKNTNLSIITANRNFSRNIIFKKNKYSFIKKIYLYSLKSDEVNKNFNQIDTVNMIIYKKNI